MTWSPLSAPFTAVAEVGCSGEEVVSAVGNLGETSDATIVNGDCSSVELLVNVVDGLSPRDMESDEETVVTRSTVPLTVVVSDDPELSEMLENPVANPGRVIYLD